MAVAEVSALLASGYCLKNSKARRSYPYLRRPDRVEGAPDLAAWADLERVGRTAASAVGGRARGCCTTITMIAHGCA